MKMTRYLSAAAVVHPEHDFLWFYRQYFYFGSILEVISSGKRPPFSKLSNFENFIYNKTYCYINILDKNDWNNNKKNCKYII